MVEAPTERRDHAYLLLLLLVGGAAIAAGLFLLITQGTSSSGAVFDVVLGFAILLVGWLFLGPLLAPSWFGDRGPTEPTIQRPYLQFPIATPAPVVSQPAPAPVYAPPAPPVSRSPPPARPSPESPAPWDESVLPRASQAQASHAMPMGRPRTPRGAPAPEEDEADDDFLPDLPEDPLAELWRIAGVPPPRTTATAEADDPFADLPEPPAPTRSRKAIAVESDDNPEGPWRSAPAASPAETAGAPADLPAPEMLRELDLISAELRGPSRRRPAWDATKAQGSTRRSRPAGGASGGADAGVADEGRDDLI